MGILAVFLIGVVLFYWFAFWGTVWAWFCAIVDLCHGRIIRAAIWFCIGAGMLLWWFGKETTFDQWWYGSLTVVGAAVVIAFVNLLQRREKAVKPTTEPLPEPGTGPVTFVQNNLILVKTTRDGEEVWVRRIDAH